MTTNLQKLQSVLASWTAADQLPHPAERLALEILVHAEQTLDEEGEQDLERETWHQFLDATRTSPFLLALADAARRDRWAEVCFRAIRRSGYTLEIMFEQRVARHPDRPLFRLADAPPGAAWSYAQVHNQARRFAATFLRMSEATPHVALWLANSIQGACCDLACLTFGVPNTPISVHADDDELHAISKARPFDIVVTDSPDRYARLVALRRQSVGTFSILRLDATGDVLEEGDDRLLRAQAALGSEQVDEALSRRARLSLDDAATLMFTPGPTGAPKGVVFSGFNLVTKRFARAAALPRIGEDEVLLCYLPLFHTFGRFLEMLGSVFWGGTYVFASASSIESLLAGMRNVRPTTLVSIPLRWSQIHQRVLAEAGENADQRALERACARITGGRLRWGLSAAGYLAPGVFRFFHEMGIALCSGFGMTEATGGVTMTPPEEYVDGSVGIPLPGMRVKLSSTSELLIGGPYVARHLGDPAPSPDAEPWTPTGDLFRLRPDGHYEIFDKIKDIYKNTRGQTIAPKRIENHFVGVAEVRQVMLVGDGRDDNTLLIFPAFDAPNLQGLDRDEFRAFFHRLVLAANRQLVSYERVVDFAIVEEPMTADELREDGTLHRKAVLTRHRAVVDAMYEGRARTFAMGGVKVLLPRWLFRELGILLSDLQAEGSSLVDRIGDRALRIEVASGGRVRVGDLSYDVADASIDLGRLTLQPALWLGNAGLAGFFPCKEGWDVSPAGIGACPDLPERDLHTPVDITSLPPGYDTRLREAHRLAVISFGMDGPRATTAVERLGDLLSRGHDRLDTVILRRLRSLANHPRAAVRSRAFRALLAYGDDVDGQSPIISFLASGHSFLSEDTLSYVANHRVEHAPLQTLREALRAYRVANQGPASPLLREQLEQVFELLVHVSRRSLSVWTAAREELATWTLLDDDPDLATLADDCLARLHRPHGARGSNDSVRVGWQEQPKLMPELGGHPSDEQLQDALADQRFLAQSAAVLTESSVRPFLSSEGLVVTRESGPNLAAVRVGWAGDSAHADLVLTALDEDKDASANARWRLALRGASSPWPLVPAMGLWHERFDVVSTEMVDAPSVWDRIRRHASDVCPDSDAWRAIFVRGMAACIRVWAATGQTRMVRNAGPANVLMYLPDEAEHGCVRELELGAGSTSFGGIVDALDREFYERTARHYPWCRDSLSLSWLFDACVEALGAEPAEDCIRRFAQAVRNGPWTTEAKRYLACGEARKMAPLAAKHALGAYRGWLDANPQATVPAKAQCATGLSRAHGLERFGDVVRYQFWRDTVFADERARTVDTFDALIEAMTCRDCEPTELVQLTDLQNRLSNQELREVLRILVFPEAHRCLRPGLHPRARRQGARDAVHVTDAAGRSHSIRTSRNARDVSAVLQEAWKSGAVRSFWSDELAMVLSDDRDHALGGALLRLGELGDLVFDGPFLGAHVRGTGLDQALVDAIEAYARTQGASVVRSVRSRPVRNARAWHTEHAWGGYVKR